MSVTHSLRSLPRSVPVALSDSPTVTAASFDFAVFSRMVSGTLARSVHVVQAASASDLGLAAGFVFALLAKLHQTSCILWVSSAAALVEGGRIYGPGILDRGVCPGNVVFVDAGRGSDVLWAVEEGLRSGAVGAVVCEFGQDAVRLDLTATRRLALRSEQAGVPCYLTALAPADGLGPNAARTRWLVAPTPSRSSGLLGEPAWALELLKNRDGPCGRIAVGFSRSSAGFHEVAASPERRRLQAFRSKPHPAPIAPLVLPFARRVAEGDRR